MRCRKAALLLSVSAITLLFLVAPSAAQRDLGNYTVSGEAEVGGLVRHKSGNNTKFEEYRDLPETVIVPQLELFIDSKKNDFYLEFGSIKPGLDDQSYRLRAGRYGLVDLEFVWDQIPHLFNVDNARTPYNMSGGNYTLRSKPPGATGAEVRDWVNARVREAAIGHDVVVDGRDIGTVVFPDADLKVFLIADPWERARRRLVQRLGRRPDDSEIAAETELLVQRDARDATQTVQALDAVLIDTTSLTQSEQVDRIVALAGAKGA